ncbi:MAG: shikimate dehydrogenase [Saprospiraceae bacterium]|nr:shikimate dehydrogenase [Saprospiraceae bacterium]
MKRLYGLIGFPLSHSFSKRYFTEKFVRENLTECSYELFPLDSIKLLPELLKRHPELLGFNVTIPYKQAVLHYLDELDSDAEKVGAVNTVVINSKSRLVGYNTDVIGFRQSLVQARSTHHRALVLGSGGASKAVTFVLDEMHVPYTLVSRHAGNTRLIYSDINKDIISNCDLIINTTPLGMYPEVDSYPPIPYHFITEKHLLYDLVYNPPQTLFMIKGKAHGAEVLNGLEMLYLQAEAAWELWNPAKHSQ